MLFVNFTLKALFVLKTFEVLFSLFNHVEKQSHLNDKVNFKIYGVGIWETNN